MYFDAGESGLSECKTTDDFVAHFEASEHYSTLMSQIEEEGRAKMACADAQKPNAATALSGKLAEGGFYTQDHAHLDTYVSLGTRPMCMRRRVKVAVAVAAPQYLCPVVHVHQARVSGAIQRPGVGGLSNYQLCCDGVSSGNRGAGVGQ